MFIRAADVYTPQGADTRSAAQTLAPTAEPTAEPTATAAEVLAQTPSPTPETVVTPAPEDGQVVVDGFVFSDAVDYVDGAVTTQTASQAAPLSATMEAAGLVTSPPEGTWSYEDSAIQVHITRHHQDDFVYFAADIQLTDPSQFTYAFSHEKYGAGTEALSDIAQRHNPLVAINGDYYSFHDNGIIIRGGELFRKKNSARALLIVEGNGDLSVLTDRTEKQGVVANRLLERGALHTFEFGPVLVQGGEAVRLHSAILRVDEGYLEPRTAIGQYGPLHYLVIVVDGRSKGYSEGCDLPTLQQLFMDFGVETAFNLDGGGSTTLWYDGEVINQPASGDERKVSDIVMFMK